MSLYVRKKKVLTSDERARANAAMRKYRRQLRGFAQRAQSSGEKVTVKALKV